MISNPARGHSFRAAFVGHEWWSGERKTRAAAPVGRWASFIADILFGAPAPLAPEGDEVWFGVPDFVPGYHHECAAVHARRILSGVQRIEQEFLVAGHSVLSPRPNFQPERWLLNDPLQPPRRQKTRRREPAGSAAPGSGRELIAHLLSRLPADELYQEIASHPDVPVCSTVVITPIISHDAWEQNEPLCAPAVAISFINSPTRSWMDLCNFAKWACPMASGIARTAADRSWPARPFALTARDIPRTPRQTPWLVDSVVGSRQEHSAATIIGS
jgi:hypothetical protein